jgi:hypothetical protein
LDDELHDFLTQGPYCETAGAVAPFNSFLREYVAWLGSDERVMWWTQSHRVRNALLKAGFPIGRVKAFGMRPDQICDAYIGNLSGPHSRSISALPIEFDPGCCRLAPRDLTEREQDQLRKRPAPSQCPATG